MNKRISFFPPVIALILVLSVAKGIKAYITRPTICTADYVLPVHETSSVFRLPPVLSDFSAGHSAYIFFVAGLLATLIAGLLLSRSIAARPRCREFSGWSIKLTFAATDTLILLVAFVLLGYPGPNSAAGLLGYEAKTVLLHLALTLLAIAWFWVGLEQYARRRPFWDELREIVHTVGVLLVLSGAIIFYVGIDAGRSTTLWTWASAFALLPLGRTAARALLDSKGLWRQPVLIIGNGDNARAAWQALRSEQWMGYQVFAFVDISSRGTGEVPPATLTIAAESYPVLRPVPTLDELLDAHRDAQLVVALDDLASSESHTLIQQLAASRRNIHVIPPIRGLPLFGTQLSHFFRHEVLFLTVRNNLSRRSYRWVKRAFDLVAATSLLILFSPLFLVISSMIRKSGGTAFYGHTRVGRDGKPFQCLKFRTMRPDADKVLKELLASDPKARAEWEKDFKLKNDPRITPVGRFLRKTSLDELPQLINVIKGEMSLVGPRPIVDAELGRYGDYASLYLRVLPGVTGLWQVSGRNDATYAERVSLDAWYVQNWSIWYDVAILFKTLNVVLYRRGAY